MRDYRAVARLTSRERDILGYVALGHTSAEIGGDLGISERTVKWHVSNVMHRLRVASRAEALAVCLTGAAPELADRVAELRRHAGGPDRDAGPDSEARI